MIDGGSVARWRRRWCLRSLVSAGLCAALFVWVSVVPAGQRWDASTFGGLEELRTGPWVGVWSGRTAVLVVLVALVLAAAAVAVIRRRGDAVTAALGAMLLVGGTALVAESVKAVLPRPLADTAVYAAPTFPSVHTAVASAAVIALIWLSPRSVDTAVRAGAVVCVAFAAAASLLSFAHTGGDVIGGVFVAGAVAAALLAVAPARVVAPASASAPTRSRARRRPGALRAAALAVAVVAIAVAVVAPALGSLLAAMVTAALVVGSQPRLLTSPHAGGVV